MVCDLNRALKWNLVQPDEFRHAIVRPLKRRIKGSKRGNFYVRFSSFLCSFWSLRSKKMGKNWNYDYYLVDCLVTRTGKEGIAKKATFRCSNLEKNEYIDCMFVQWFFILYAVLCRVQFNSMKSVLCSLRLLLNRHCSP